MTKQIAILGSTGSIGTNSLRVLEALGEDYQVYGMTAHNNVKLFAEQVRKFLPKVVGLTNPKKLDEFRGYLGDSDVEILCGADSLTEISGSADVDIVIGAIVGSAGLEAILKAAKAGKIIAIANKEPLVIAGELLMATAKENGAVILPVDSEHSAIFQSLHAGDSDEVNKIILTASGGPFRGASAETIAGATIAEALAHPTWNMGRKISIDSATMMNKALEIIEAKWLFDIEVDKIDVLVHPESIVHSMVEFVDGSVIAQLSGPDMCLPIQYALTYPKRVRGITRHLKLEEIGLLTFEKADMEIFKALKLGFEVGRVGGSAAAVFNAANEMAVEEFLAGNIKFVTIVDLIEHCLSKHNINKNLTLEELLAADAWARREVTECLKKSR
ncbi:MAG: 1-deoxy-D-xylulose-5-phosphate reductoisomerase [Anaerohalosphaeraceae bacterium]|nr:1-deoxy-D-xylulose-5-phosphate reductoisomerase [Anaerohalosphaeraceae bacterium]